MFMSNLLIIKTHFSGLIGLQGSNHFKKRQCALKTYLQGGVEKVLKFCILKPNHLKKILLRSKFCILKTIFIFVLYLHIYIYESILHTKCLYIRHQRCIKHQRCTWLPRMEEDSRMIFLFLVTFFIKKYSYKIKLL